MKCVVFYFKISVKLVKFDLRQRMHLIFKLLVFFFCFLLTVNSRGDVLLLHAMHSTHKKNKLFSGNYLPNTYLNTVFRYKFLGYTFFITLLLKTIRLDDKIYFRSACTSHESSYSRYNARKIIMSKNRNKDLRRIRCRFYSCKKQFLYVAT